MSNIPDHQLYAQFPSFSGLGFLDELSSQNDHNQANAGSMNPSEGLSVDEQKVYDRQIRIWGLETQNLMRQSRVLFVGHMNGLGAEICKNLVLSGIGALSICDNVKITPTSFLSNFLLSETYAAADFNTNGKHVNDQLTEGQASLNGLRALNPNVEINHVMKPEINISDLLQQIDLKTYTIVICSGIDMLDAVYLNHQCRLVGQMTSNGTAAQPNPLFIYTDLHANYGIGFFDMNKSHNYFVPKVEAVVNRNKAALQKAKASAGGNDGGKKDQNEGTHYLTRSVSLGTSLSLIGIPIDELMKARMDCEKGQNAANLANIPLLNEVSLTTSLPTLSNLNTSAAKYNTESYVAAIDGEGDGANGQYQGVDQSDARRSVKRSLKQSHIINYFLTNYTCPTTERIGSLPSFPNQLVDNASGVVKNGSEGENGQNGTFLINANLINNNNGITHGIELSGFTAVLGGLIAQEIIKSFQHKTQMATQYNWLNFDMSGTGTCEAARIM